MNVRFKKTGQGEVAILPRAEYEKLVARAAEADEDAGTARLVARARKEVAGGAALIPFEVAERIANGESPIRVLREWRGLTQMHLARRTSMSQGYISDIEKSRRQGTAVVLRAIAEALKVPLDMLVTE
ncbi:MAG: helix-turn-helix transcriptional regulator [Pseudolabrys sp.]|jgi:ribosome-binding protein aMBF1 (putative translation factor)